MKMLVIGLGKHQGALLAHRAAIDVGLDRMVPEVARVSLSACDPLRPRQRRECPTPDGPDRGHAAGGPRGNRVRLLQEAWRLLGRIPFEFLHLLIVDEMGKDVSGTGMDPNVVARMYLYPNEEPKSPRYVRIVVRDLTAKTAGNAVGMGLADFTTRRLVNKVNFHYTYTNALTGLSPMRSKMPIVFETDREAIEGALKTIGLTEPPDAKIARIKNTLALEYLHVSEALLPEITSRQDLEVLEGPFDFQFTASGDLAESYPVGFGDHVPDVVPD